MTNTPNKNFPLQTTGTHVGTWGTIVNDSVFSVLDNNLGGTLALSVAGNSNINLTSSQSSFLMHDLTGVLTGNIAYIFPAMGGFYAINNQTTGAFTVTVQIVGGGASVLAIQGQTTIVFIDATGLNVLAGSAGTVNSGTAGQLAFYSTTGTIVSGDANATISAGDLTLGTAGGTQGSLRLAGSISGTTILAAPHSGTGTMTLQAGTDTLVAKATTDTLTNKTFDTAGTGNILRINGTQITSISGNTAKVASVTGALTSGHVATFDASGNIQDGGTAPVPLNSPAFTGIPTAPTAANGTNTTQLATAAFAYGTLSAASPGYQKLPSGLILQWGTVTAAASPSGPQNISFPIAFPNAVFNVICNPTNANSGDEGYHQFNSPPTTSGFSMLFTANRQWFAIGN